MQDFRWVINLGNSICGVSLLVLPYCFTQCGIFLGILLLLFSAILTTWSCHLLLENVFVCKIASYEGIAKELYGSFGKRLVEVSSIILNIGCCSAFFVILSDLIPGVLSWVSGRGVTDPLSPGIHIFILSFLAVTVILPLSLIRNLEPLNSISIISMTFYIFLTLQLAFWAVPVLEDKDIFTTVPLVTVNGLFSVLPIYALAFSCHLQLLAMTREVVGEVKDGMWEELHKMKWISKGAVLLVGVVYGLVSLFGYIAFSSTGVKPDVLSNFNNGYLAQITRCGFVISILFSFPFMVNPCRATLYSSLYGRTDKYIPTSKHVILTSSIVFIACFVAVTIPNVAIVVSLTGAVSGAMICYLFPSVMYLYNPKIKHTTKQTRKAYILISIGIILLTGGTISAITPTNDNNTVTNVGGNDILINAPTIITSNNDQGDNEVGGVKQSEVDQPVLPVVDKSQDNPLIGDLAIGQVLTGARTLQEDKRTEEIIQTNNNNNNVNNNNIQEINNNNNIQEINNNNIQEMSNNNIQEMSNNNGQQQDGGNNNNNNKEDGIINKNESDNNQETQANERDTPGRRDNIGGGDTAGEEDPAGRGDPAGEKDTPGGVGIIRGDTSRVIDGLLASNT